VRQSIEPKFYVPVLPLVLINGAEGIGTGWSTHVCNYNPREVVANLKRMINGEACEPMNPWYRGFTGTITPADVKGTSFTTYGSVAKLDETSVHISELPIRKWTQDYKDGVLEPMLSGTTGGDKDKESKKCEPTLDDVREHHTDTTVSFTLRFAGGANVLSEHEAKGTLHKTLKLSSSISTSNMTLFDEHARIVKHESPVDILTAFYNIRLDFYEKRKVRRRPHRHPHRRSHRRRPHRPPPPPPPPPPLPGVASPRVRVRQGCATRVRDKGAR
jgi:DNA topoisomerase-2